MEKADFSTIFRALRHRNYRLFFIGQGMSLVGTWFQQTAEVWLAWRLTHSAWALGVVGFASQIPTFLLAAPAGAWVDRSDKRRFVIMAQTFEMIQAFVLAALVLTHRITYPLLIWLSLFGGAFDALEIPSRQSFIIDMVEDPADLPNAIALNSSLANVTRFVGPTMAGLLIAVSGEGECFLLNGMSYLAVIISLLVIRVPRRAPDRVLSHPWHTFQEGFHYAAGSVPIRTLLWTLAVISITVSSYSVLIPVFAAQVLHGGPHTLGFLMAAAGAGATTAALYLASRKTVVGLGRIVGIGITLLGGALAVFSLSRWFWLSWWMMMLGGLGMVMSTASINTMLQTLAEPDKRGRVMSFFTMAFIGMAPLGNFIGGALAEQIGAPLSVRCSGAVCLVVVLWYLRRLPTLREHIRPIYRRLGIIPEIAAGLQAASSGVKPRA